MAVQKNNHGGHEVCADCDQNLLRYNGKLYVLHDATTCIKRNLNSQVETMVLDQFIVSNGQPHRVVEDEGFTDNYIESITSEILYLEEMQDMADSVRNDPNEIVVDANQQTNENQFWNCVTSNGQPNVHPSGSVHSNAASDGYFSGQSIAQSDDLYGGLSNNHSNDDFSDLDHVDDFNMDQMMCGSEITFQLDIEPFISDHNYERNAFEIQKQTQPSTQSVEQNINNNESLQQVSTKCATKQRAYSESQMTTNDIEYQVSESEEIHQIDDALSHDEPDSVACSEIDNIISAAAAELIVTTTDESVHETPPKTNEIQRFECDICQSTFSSRQNIRQHMQVKHNPSIEKYKCETCSTIFLHKTNFQKHKIACASKEKQALPDVVCEICGKTVKSKALVRHQRVMHHASNTVHCTICSNIFATTKELDKHRPKCISKRNQHDSISFGKQNECHVCQKMFKTKPSLEKHMRNIHDPNGKKFKCDQCDLAFPSNAAYQIHVKHKHFNIRDFKCRTCERKFKTKIHLKKHEYTHSKEKPFKCTHPGCDKQFTCKSSQKLHMNTHTGEKTLCCNIDGCDKRYTVFHGLMMHKFKVHGISNKIFSCQFCPQQFPQVGMLNKHVQLKHT